MTGTAQGPLYKTQRVEFPNTGTYVEVRQERFVPGGPISWDIEHGSLRFGFAGSWGRSNVAEAMACFADAVAYEQRDAKTAPVDTDPDPAPADYYPADQERDFAEEAYWRAFCPECGTSPCEVDGEHYNTDGPRKSAESPSTTPAEAERIITGERIPLDGVTDAQIGQLRRDAAEVRNYLLADYCRRALAGDQDARATVAKVLAGAYTSDAVDTAASLFDQRCGGLLAALNSYAGDNIWQDIILPSGIYDEQATGNVFGPDAQASDRFAASADGGTLMLLFRWDVRDGRWFTEPVR